MEAKLAEKGGRRGVETQGKTYKEIERGSTTKKGEEYYRDYIGDPQNAVCFICYFICLIYCFICFVFFCFL